MLLTSQDHELGCFMQELAGCFVFSGYIMSQIIGDELLEQLQPHRRVKRREKILPGQSVAPGFSIRHYRDTELCHVVIASVQHDGTTRPRPQGYRYFCSRILSSSLSTRHNSKCSNMYTRPLGGSLHNRPHCSIHCLPLPS